jgi:ATP-dependent Lhr-like helicase
VNLHEQKNQSLLDDVPWDLLRAIAVIQLYLEERWVEPFELKPKPFSLLAHQTLSVLMMGDLSPADLARHILLLPAFRDIVSLEEYRGILRHMITNDYLQRMDSGSIIVGLKGERLTNHYSFYAVFQDEQVYHVHSNEEEIGTLNNCPAVDEIFVLAGRSWKVQSVDEERKVVYVYQVKSIRIPNWSGSGGQINTRIVQRMRQVLEEDVQYSYLRPNAVQLLEQARCFTRENKILRSNIIPCGTNSFFLCPWVGTKELQSIKALFSCGMKDVLEIYSIFGGRHYLHITSDLSPNAFIKRMETFTIDIDDPDLILPIHQVPKIDKYDALIPDELLRKAFLYNELNVPGAIDVLKQLCVDWRSM